VGVEECLTVRTICAYNVGEGRKAILSIDRAFDDKGEITMPAMHPVTPLRKRRLALGLSQAALAQRLGFRTHSHYSRIESGERDPQPETIERLARVFGVKAETVKEWVRS